MLGMSSGSSTGGRGGLGCHNQNVIKNIVNPQKTQKIPKLATDSLYLPMGYSSPGPVLAPTCTISPCWDAEALKVKISGCSGTVLTQGMIIWTSNYEIQTEKPPGP